MMLEQGRVQNLFQEKVEWFVVFAPKLYLFFSWVHSFFFFLFSCAPDGYSQGRGWRTC